MKLAEFSFKAVRDSLHKILEEKIDARLSEYYAMTVGLICIYSRPSTKNYPVGEPAHRRRCGLDLITA